MIVNLMEFNQDVQISFYEILNTEVHPFDSIV